MKKLFLAVLVFDVLFFMLNRQSIFTVDRSPHETLPYYLVQPWKWRHVFTIDTPPWLE